MSIKLKSAWFVKQTRTMKDNWQAHLRARSPWKADPACMTPEGDACRRTALQPLISALGWCIRYHTDSITDTIIHSILCFRWLITVHPLPQSENLGIALDFAFFYFPYPTQQVLWLHQSLPPLCMLEPAVTVHASAALWLVSLRPFCSFRSRL